MHRFVVYALLSFLLFALGCASPGGRPPKRVRPADEIRAVWVDSWGDGLYTEEQCNATVAWAWDHGFNTVIVEVRKVGDAYYKSLYEPRGINAATGLPLAADFDPLATLVAAVRARPGMRIEAWIVANRIWKGSPQPPPMTPAHIALTHPQWLLLNQDEKPWEEGAETAVFIDPSDQGARNHVSDVAADIAEFYDVDAVHLDYIRYPANTWGYGTASLGRFRAETGRTDTPQPTDPEFTKWRADQVTKQVREIRDRVKVVKPKCQLTASVVAWGAPSPNGYRDTKGYLGACQDWPTWMAEDLVDAIYVMHYKREHVVDQARDYRMWFNEFRKFHDRSSPRLVIGVGCYMNEIDASMKQIADGRTAGFDGVAVFSYRVTNSGTVDRAAFGEALLRGPFRPEP